MKNVTQFWNLDNPKMARDFLKQVRFGKPGTKGNKIEFLINAAGEQISIDDASDEQILQVAKEFGQAFARVKK